MKYEFQHSVIILNIITRICEQSVWESLSKYSIQWTGFKIVVSESKQANNLSLKSRISLFFSNSKDIAIV